MMMSSLKMMFLPVRIFLLCSVLVVLAVQSFTLPSPRNDAGSQVRHEPSPPLPRIRQHRHMQQQQQQQLQQQHAPGKRHQPSAAGALNHPEHRPYSVTGARKTTRPPYTRIPAVAATAAAAVTDDDDSGSDDHLYAPATSDPLPSLLSYEDQELGDMMLQETTRGDDHRQDHNSELRSYASRQRQRPEKKQQLQQRRQPEQQDHDQVTPEFYSLTPSSSLLSPSASVAKDMVAESSHHHDQHEWLDMGAYSGKQGSFGWYADFPVGGIDSAKAGGHGRRK